MRNIRLAICFAIAAVAGQATQKQEISISAPLAGITGVPVRGELTVDETRTLVTKAFGTEMPQKGRAYLVHVVKYQSTKLAPSVQNWYVYDEEETRTLNRFELRGNKHYMDPRIFGRKELAMVYLHILPAISQADAKKALLADGMTDTAATELSQKGSTSDGKQLVSMGGNQALAPLGDYLVQKGFDSLKSLTYSISIESKDPAPYSNLKDLAGFAFTSQSAVDTKKLTLTDTAFVAGENFETLYLPSNLSVTASYSKNDKDVEIGKLTYDNEARYFYDFSLALPVATYDDLKYDQASNAITARTIKKTNLYGMFNFGLRRDTKKVLLQPIPTLLYGIPITGQPLKHHLFAASVGINYLNFFAGVRLDQKNFYSDFSKPLTGDNVRRVWRTHLAYGINFPVGTIVQALTKKK